MKGFSNTFYNPSRQKEDLDQISEQMSFNGASEKIKIHPVSCYKHINEDPKFDKFKQSEVYQISNRSVINATLNLDLVRRKPLKTLKNKIEQLKQSKKKCTTD